MARYSPATAANAKTVQELKRSQTAENLKIANSVNANEQLLLNLLDAIEAATDFDDLGTRVNALRIRNQR